MFYKLNEGVFTYKNDEDEKDYIINTNTKDVFLVNQVAQIILLNIEERKSSSEIIEIICENFPGSSLKEMEADFREFISELEIREFITKA